MPDTISLKTKKEIWNERQKKGMESSENNEHEKSNDRNNLITWSAPEFIKYEKDFSWFAATGIIAAVIFIISLITKNYVFAIVIILSAFSLYIWAQKEPKKYKFKINHRGIAIGKNVYNYDNLKSFWIFYDPPRIKYLSVESKKMLMPKITVPIGEEDPNKIREILVKFLPEEEHEESLIDAIGRHLRY